MTLGEGPLTRSRAAASGTLPRGPDAAGAGGAPGRARAKLPLRMG